MDITPADCPEEIENLGCFKETGYKPYIFSIYVMSRAHNETLEKFLCNCANKVQSMGRFSLALTFSKKLFTPTNPTIHLKTNVTQQMMRVDMMRMEKPKRV